MGGRPDGANPATVTLCGAYPLDPARAHPLLRDLPDALHLPARSGHRPEIRAAVELLAAKGGLSRAAFARRFAAMVGRPPLGCLTWWRMTTAARLLRESDSPLSAPAEQVGYSSEFAFGNAFKREYGLAPGRYRRQQRPVTPGGRTR
ncbi:hypothetical protein ASE03_05900 [Kitasatospora sp. Root187]|nr:hypothetical protein ASC99_06955 [Kitasatospora sp. Root107]KRB64069.1 hypothetical protein ASE03_05900 [Kitasatospora sp. Root187]